LIEKRESIIIENERTNRTERAEISHGEEGIGKLVNFHEEKVQF
jgi:hypothetical protein